MFNKLNKSVILLVGGSALWKRY